MLALQTDVYSDFDRFCAQRFAYSIDHAPRAGARVRQAADLMRNWDGKITADSAAATVAVASRQELTRLLLEPRVGALWQDYQWFMAPVWLESMLLHQPARWLPAGYAGWDELLAAAVSAAVDRSGISQNLNEARWGKDHYVDIEHPLFGTIPLLRPWTGTGRTPQSGDGYTVKQVGQHFGPSERLTVDLSNLDASTLNIVNGESGQIFSPHYMDQWHAWYEGTTFTLPFSPAAVESEKADVLELQP
jgi:penicillin amidase